MTQYTRITVKHNVEMAHRLYLTPGKCEAIHGHSWNIELGLSGPVDSRGILCGLDFGFVKKEFRGMLDTEFDHRVLLNEDDPWAGAAIMLPDRSEQLIPGIQTLHGDPTTENFAGIIGNWARDKFVSYGVNEVYAVVFETAVNSADWQWLQ